VCSRLSERTRVFAQPLLSPVGTLRGTPIGTPLYTLIGTPVGTPLYTPVGTPVGTLSGTPMGTFRGFLSAALVFPYEKTARLASTIFGSHPSVYAGSRTFFVFMQKKACGVWLDLHLRDYRKAQRRRKQHHTQPHTIS